MPNALYSKLAEVSLSVASKTTTTTTPPKTAAGGSGFLIFIVVIFALVYFLFLRPRQNRMRQSQARQRDLSVGDEVVTIGGISGTIVSLDDEDAIVEVAPGVELKFLRRAVNPRSAMTTPPPVRRGFGRSAPPPPPVEEPVDENDYDQDDDREGLHEGPAGEYPDGEYPDGAYPDGAGWEGQQEAGRQDDGGHQGQMGSGEAERAPGIHPEGTGGDSRAESA